MLAYKLLEIAEPNKYKDIKSNSSNDRSNDNFELSKKFINWMEKNHNLNIKEFEKFEKDFDNGKIISD